MLGNKSNWFKIIGIISDSNNVSDSGSDRIKSSTVVKKVFVVAEVVVIVLLVVRDRIQGSYQESRSKVCFALQRGRSSSSSQSYCVTKQ